MGPLNTAELVALHVIYTSNPLIFNSRTNLALQANRALEGFSSNAVLNERLWFSVLDGLEKMKYIVRNNMGYELTVLGFNTAKESVTKLQNILSVLVFK